MGPDESCTIMCGETGERPVEGISDGLVSGTFGRHRALVDGWYIGERSAGDTRG